MTDKTRTRIVVDEDDQIIQKIDAIADAEGLSRSDILRRAIRRYLLSLSAVPESGNNPQEQVAA